MHPVPVHPVPDDEHARIAASTFRMLADPTRVKILWALFRAESSVNALAEVVGATPAAVSQHLAKLRLAGFVESRKEGTYAFYRASDTHVRRLLQETLSHAEHVTGVAGPGPHEHEVGLGE